jgi:hypothetical protein
MSFRIATMSFRTAIERRFRTSPNISPNISRGDIPMISIVSEHPEHPEHLLSPYARGFLIFASHETTASTTTDPTDGGAATDRSKNEVPPPGREKMFEMFGMFGNIEIARKPNGEMFGDVRDVRKPDLTDLMARPEVRVKAEFN